MTPKVQSDILNSLRHTPEVFLTDEFGEVRHGPAVFPLNEARDAVTKLERAGMLTLVRSFGPSRSWAITEAGMRAAMTVEPQVAGALTPSQLKIMRLAQQDGGALTLKSLSAAGLHLATLISDDLPALLRMGLIERLQGAPDDIFPTYALTAAGRTYAPDTQPQRAEAPLLRAIDDLRAKWCAHADDETTQRDAEDDPELKINHGARAAMLRACADDLGLLLKEGQA